MDIRLLKAAEYFITNSKFVISAENLRTKIRINLSGDFYLDLYFNPTFGKYSYTLVRDRRILGWDNAPHHKGLKNYPHHFHDSDGNAKPSGLVGDPERDIRIILTYVDRFLQHI